ncbi:hypothetical protein [Nitrosomonas aestuarii]|uniref:hypothetical protein n=1 Tax=Nitrosomonas aestuarii TaxID=52441 RepID=UPI000D305F20|nr:hypothetical protein [Nitrosomonas aestuarii]PTN11648.1 hypothetical protein C8R11_10867 [Nitrosomonas aestuarii]
MKNCSDLISSNVHLHIRDGTSQTSRLLPALDPAYFQLMDLRFHSLLAMAVDYAERMKFYNIHNAADGNWKSYFSADETVIIAIILSTDTKKLATFFKNRQYPDSGCVDVMNALHAALPAENQQQLIALYNVSVLLDNWLASLRSTQSQTGHELHQLIAGIITGLNKELQLLLQCFAYFLPDKPLDMFFSKDLIKLLKVPESEKQSVSLDFSDRPIDQLAIRSSFYAVVKAIEMAQRRSADLLTTSLQSQRHDPATGLLIAFLQLFQRLHQKINRFTPGLVDFYYEQVLGAQAHPFEPDHTYLVVTLVNEKQTKWIPKGTVFLADRHSGKQETLYVSDDDVLIHGAKVGATHTLFFNRDRLNSSENRLQETVFLPNISKKKNRQLATSCWLNSIPIISQEALAARSSFVAYPILGAPKNTETESLSVSQARIGFALASKTLLLKEGHRNINITLKFADAETNPEQDKFHHWIHKIAAVLKSSQDNDTEAIFTKEEAQDIFFKVFSNIFVIHLTGEEGWLPVDEYVPIYSGIDESISDNSLQIAFTLPADAPAITAYSSEVHGERYETQLPVVKFTLNPRGYLYPYNILNKLVLDWIKIDVSVSGNRTLVLHNQLGQLSALTSFNPFGPLPEVGSYLLVGCTEAAVKQLTHFSLEIKWGGLPPGIGGFNTYYHGYDSPSNHNDFKINKSVLMEGKWLPEETAPETVDTLFQIKNSHHASNVLSETKQISCDALIPYWSSSDYFQTIIGLSYTPSSKKGFFKFTLTEPLDAFGHKKYPQILARALTHNARQRISKLRKAEPNTPYTPMVTSILANYHASSRITTGKSDNDSCLSTYQEKLIHLHPMGWENTAMQSGQAVFLLPQYTYSGNLLIGLETFDAGGLITLYFYLRENSLPTEHHSVEKLQWFFLSSNQWMPLSPKEVIADSTHGFMTSGIVTLDVPADINQGNTIMPDCLFWLCVSADQDMEKFCSLYAVFAQAIQVSRYLPGGEDIHKLTPFNSLPAGSIKQTKQSLPGVDNIWQVQSSVGGRSVENKIDVRIRMSERLRHKNRALLPLDYEQLLLARFPQIYKAKCFANLSPEYDSRYQRICPRICSGHVTIAVLPYPVKQTRYGEQLWLSGHMVNAARDFINQYTSSFVTVHFVNPVYETIQVRCTVKLRNARNGGLYLGKLNDAISAYISPWHDTVGYTTHFGWCINKFDVQSYIQQLDFIDRVTNFSILRITPDGNALFNLLDSVAESKVTTESCEITPRYPWSIAEPMQQHFIEVDDSYVTIEPEITGIGELEIGSTFIIQNRDGETK